MFTWNSSDGTRAKLAIEASPCGVFSSRNTITFAAIKLMVTHWKRTDRSGFSSERGMKTTGTLPGLGWT
jgi:hypothetical protein